jgi:protein-S-isoprenylcysteine O-methyltransferase Ste14
MYTGTLVMLVGIPLALIWRLLDKEKFLSANLSGYREYTARSVRV